MPKSAVRILVAALAGIAMGATALWAMRRLQAPAVPEVTSGSVSTSAKDARWLKGELHAHSNGKPPGDVLRDYAQRGYSFVVFTDPGQLTRPASLPDILAFAGVEVGPGKDCALHVDALFVPDGARPPPAPKEGADCETGLKDALDTTRSLRGLALLSRGDANATVPPGLLAEVAQDGAAVFQAQDAAWDDALSNGARLWGAATGDGFVMVHAPQDAASIRAALEQGNFYASTGVMLSKVEVTQARLALEVGPESPGAHRFEFFGKDGALLGDRTGRDAAFRLDQAQGGYVRAVVTGPSGQKAWTQPVFVP